MSTSNGTVGVLPQRDRDRHARWLLEITQIPTAAGREQRVIEWIRAWVAERPGMALRADRAGNLVVEMRPSGRGTRPKGRPIFITAHMDHPAFVVERIVGPGTLELAFRGGVNDDYFTGAAVVIHASHPGDGRPPVRVSAKLSGEGGGVAGNDGSRLFKTFLAEADPDAEADIRIGDIATWELPPGEIDGRGLVHTHACDDLAALAAALSAFDTLFEVGRSGRKIQDVRLLFTRSEEIGFTGAIAACKLGTMPKNARVIALENSRSFADSPIGGGPIVRVGDRLTVFSPGLTAACAKRAEDIAGRAAGPTATQKSAEFALGAVGLKWQRKLMAGGACEATVFCAYGYEATCLCLALGNYHNMADLQAVQDGTYDKARLGPPRVGREFISVEDYHGLVDLLVAIGLELPAQDPVIERIEKLYAKHEFVLKEGAGAKAKGQGRKAKVGTKAKVGAKAKKANALRARGAKA